MSNHSKLSSVLLVLIAFRFIFHALYIPVFEGPDEPFHLARVSAFVDGPISEAITGHWVKEDIISNIVSHPCGPDLARVYGCTSFKDSEAAEFNILEFEDSNLAVRPSFNYESHHPPLYYLAGASALFLPKGIPGFSSRANNPVFRLLMMRIFSVCLVLIAVFGPILALSRSRSRAWLWSCGLLLLLPGAAESLARCANDVGVFLWTALIVWAIDRSERTSIVVCLIAIGPLIKLTALPVVCFALAWVALNRPLGHTISALASAIIFLPLQWFRGHMWGGTVELNGPNRTLDESLLETMVGSVRSLYTLLKTAFWQGEWSIFRPPLWLLAIAALFVFVLVFFSRLHAFSFEQTPHIVGLLSMVGAVAVFFLSHRLHWDQWGGVSGWYLWGWMPWLAVAFHRLIRVYPGRVTCLMWLATGVVVVANITWFWVAHSVYG